MMATRRQNDGELPAAFRPKKNRRRRKAVDALVDDDRPEDYFFIETGLGSSGSVRASSGRG